MAAEACHLAAGRALGAVAGAGTRVGTTLGAGLNAALLTRHTLLTSLCFVPRLGGGDAVTQESTAVVPAGQSSTAGTTAGERPLPMARHRTHLMFAKAGRWYGHLTGRARQSFTHKLWHRGLFPRPSKWCPAALDHDLVMAGLGAVVGAGGQGQLARLPAGGALPRVAAVGLTGCVVAGGLRSAQLFAAGGFGGSLSPARHRQGGGATHTLHLDHLRARVAAALMAG